MKRLLAVLFFAAMVIAPKLQTALATNSVNVAATVDSKVSVANSTVEVNTSETLADPTSHSILLTITLKDASGNLMADIPVTVTSSRGQVDIIEAISKIGVSGATDLATDKTDASGQAQFRITSFVAGEAIISTLADTLVTLNQVKITFDPLPFPSNVTITVTNPLSAIIKAVGGKPREITLYAPKPAIEKELSPIQLQASKLVNTGTTVTFNFWLVLAMTLLLITAPVFVILNYFNLKRVRRLETDAVKYMEKITGVKEEDIEKQP